MKVTAEDVATHAGVSRSAVSRSFSKTASVAPATRDKVLRAALELGYRPNGIASTLASGKSNIVAVITNSAPDIRRSHLLHLLNVTLQNEGFVPYMIAIDEKYEGRKTLSDLIQMPLATAIVTADSVSCQHITPHCQDYPPIMLNNQVQPGDVADQVIVDDAVGIKEMVHHLEEAGKTSLWLVTARRSSMAYETRNSAILDALVGTTVRLLDREEGDFTYEGGQHAFRNLCARGELPDCVFYANDMMAIGAMDVARFEKGIDVPGDLAFIGFDNIPQAGWPTYALPTIEQSPEMLVNGIRDILARRGSNTVSDRQMPLQITVPTRFINRTSQS